MSRRAPARRRRGRIAALIAALLVLVLGALAAPGVHAAWRATTQPRPDAPAHVDALLVLYSSPQVYEEALDLLGQGVADRAFVSAYLGPDGHEKLCGEPARRDPRLRGVSVECFSPDPVTTQGEAVYAARRMRELGLRDLGVLTFGQHLERARLLAQRCWPAQEGTVSMYAFDRAGGRADSVRQTLYGVLAYAKTAATPGCDEQLPGIVQRGLDFAKRVAGQPVDARVAALPAAPSAGRWPR